MKRMTTVTVLLQRGDSCVPREADFDYNLFLKDTIAKLMNQSRGASHPVEKVICLRKSVLEKIYYWTLEKVIYLKRSKLKGMRA